MILAVVYLFIAIADATDSAKAGMNPMLAVAIAPLWPLTVLFAAYWKLMRVLRRP